MGEWMSIAEWPDCPRLERPGILFELRNRDGQSLFTRCVATIPELPFDWTSPPEKFRLLPEVEPMHSAPLPEPQR